MINLSTFSFVDAITNKRLPHKIHDIRTEDDKAFIEASRESLNLLEKIRLKKLKLYSFRKKIGIPLAAIATPICGYIDYFLLMFQRGSDDSFAGLTFLVLGAIYWWVTQPKRQYATAYKIEILPEIAKLFGNLRYSSKGKIEMSQMKPSKIIPHHHKYKSEDNFFGEYKGIDLEFSEIHLQERRRSGKRTRYVTVFKGLAILLNTKHKRFFGHTTITRNQNKVFEWFKEKSSQLERAEMVDPEFESTFDAYTNDQVEARYLIDPIMIEKLKDLYQEYHGKGMSAAFYDNKMLILINSPYNHFEPADIHIPATNETSLINLKHEVGDILSIIDKLSLYDPDAVLQEKQAALKSDIKKRTPDSIPGLQTT